MVRLEYILERVKNMKINSSTISMDSGRSYTNSTEITQASLLTQAGSAAFTYSGTSFLNTYAEYSSSSAHQAAPQYDEYVNSAKESDLLASDLLASDLYTNLANSSIPINDAKSAFETFHKELIKRIEEFMERIKDQLLGIGVHDYGRYTRLSGKNQSSGSSVIDLTTSTQPGSFWTKQSYQSITRRESEITSFHSTGSVKTADGRFIDFNISMEMSHSFMETSEILSSETQYILTDPLVIQLDNAPDTIRDQKWFFDIDGDGKKEEISELAKRNAFLALDADNNGKIDDGNELFGTKSGDGFKDLAAYDEDGNGWIDENDSVYSNLKIWVKDASGNDKLMDLKQADIGAIYLGSTATRFSHKAEGSNELLAVVQQTGLYLHESTGSAGTIQQMDFATKPAVPQNAADRVMMSITTNRKA